MVITAARTAIIITRGRSFFSRAVRASRVVIK
jgi:hypothetical protein